VKVLKHLDALFVNSKPLSNATTVMVLSLGSGSGSGFLVPSKTLCFTTSEIIERELMMEFSYSKTSSTQRVRIYALRLTLSFVEGKNDVSAERCKSGYYSLRKSTKPISDGSRYTYRDLNPVPPEYETVI
jgi:hypothetical protein